MILGFTGTREGATEEQVKFLIDRINSFSTTKHPIKEFHHGCCVGADERAHRAIKRLGDIQIVLHPPADPKLEMEYTDWEYANCVWWPKKAYAVRNMDIVKESDILVGFAKAGSNINTIRSGTWQTVRFAKDMRKVIRVVYPDGSWSSL